jgi:hypothetical protein
MPNIRLRGLAEKSKGSNIPILSEKTGYTFVMDGEDLVIPENDEQLRHGPPAVLKSEAKAISLARENHQVIADLYVEKYLVPKLEQIKQLKEPVPVPGGYGLFTDLQAKSYEFFFASTPAQIKKVLLDKLLPFMHDKMEAKAVFPLTCDATFQQGMISIPKLVAGIEQFGADHIVKRYQEEKTFMALLPTPASVSTYPEALLMFSPFTVTLPHGKVCSHLHFLHTNLWYFPNLASQGVFELLASSHNPVPIRQEKDFLNLDELRSYGVRKYFIECINGINKLMRFFNDPLSYVTADGFLDHIGMLQAQSSVHMLFSDMLAINFSNNYNTKLRNTLAFLDKLANLVVAFQRIDPKLRNKVETDVFEGFFKPQFGKALASIVRYHLKGSYERLAVSLSRAVLSLYEKLETGDKDNENLIRAVRNSQHGPYLGRNQFQTIFFSDYKIPFELFYLPILLTWGLMLDHDRFFNISLPSESQPRRE